MTYCQIRRLVRLHEKATQHARNYKKLSGDLGAQSKALYHLRKAEPALSSGFGLNKEYEFGSGMNQGGEVSGFQSYRLTTSRHSSQDIRLIS